MIESKAVWKRGAFWAGFAAGSPALVVAAVCLVATCEARAGLGERPPPPVPSGMQVAGKMIEDAELILQERAGVAPGPDGQRRPTALNSYVADHVDPSRSATRAP